jgi:2-C-methyl-D-erythritol 4-phosphate cytidylyltransferase
VGVAVPAAGSGERMGGVRKAFLELAGEPTLRWALLPFLADPRIVRVAVALPPAEASSPPQWLTSLDARVVVVAGGRTRTESVRAAISALPDDVDVIAVHDAARPLVTSQVVARCLDLALEGFGAVAGCPAIDTLKVVGPDGSVRETPDRSSLWHAQTPQAFPAAILRAAYARPGAEGTDDAALVERADSRTVIKMVDAGPTNLKVTRLMDVTVAEAILRGRDGRGGA